MSVDPAALRPVDLFTGLTDDDLAAIAAKFEARTAEPGERFAREGASGSFFFMIVEGTAEVTRGGTVVATLGPGDCFGETAIIESTRRNATVTAVTPMVVGAMFGADFAKLADDSPELHARLRQVVAERHADD
jgi:CRP-like cAMP-binding protein